MAETDKIATASVLACEKKLVPSDGRLCGTLWDKRDESAIPLKLQEKSVRGSIFNRLKKALQDDPAKLDAEVESPICKPWTVVLWAANKTP